MALVCFDSTDKLYTLLGMKDSLKKFCSKILALDKHMVSFKRMVWINVLGIPFKFWNVDFSHPIQILVASSHDPIPSSSKLVLMKNWYCSRLSRHTF